MRSKLMFLAAALAIPATHLHARAPVASSDWVLDVPAIAEIGSTITVCAEGPANEFGLFMASLGQGPLQSKKYGTIELDFPLLTSFVFLFDGNGDFCFDVDVDIDPSIVGVTVYAQFLTCDPFPGLSNQDSTTIAIEEACRIDDSIGSNFNGTDIDPGKYVWFNAVVDVKDLAEAPAVMQFRGGAVSFTADGIDYFVALPDAVIVVSDTATEASTYFDAARNEWQTFVPAGYDGNIFLTGVGFEAAGGLPGGINPVDWSGTFVSDTAGVTLQWKWAAAVYCSFSDDLNAIGVKPIDGSNDNPYANSDHAGTPENFKDEVTGGARGGGGSNFTGSYSGTSKVTFDC